MTLGRRPHPRAVALLAEHEDLLGYFGGTESLCDVAEAAHALTVALDKLAVLLHLAMGRGGAL